ncbi:DUF1653 domain-containing protein [Patescibacteria group bacterium]|nr:DUF1653 domain-containing protein [Patescibacteria group bacterium]MBU1868431.1 DUF1653 domain-containing protein [Patescibacteria group bacterium]
MVDLGRLSQIELSREIEKAKKQIVIGGKYQHYKDESKHYRVIDIGLQVATRKACVVYQALYGKQLVWVRNLDDWLSVVEIKADAVPRFQKVQE